jgi:hypothetical protein
MTQKKIPIPLKIQREVLFRNEACCCICGKSNVQIHHIDGNNSNHELSNLAVLCVEHHDSASSKSSMTRKLSSSLIRQFKKSWETRVINRRRIIRSKITKDKGEQTFIKFEIKKLVFSLPAFPQKSTTNSTIDQLFHWHLFTDTLKDILRYLDYIRWFLKGPQVAIVLDRLWEFFWQFVDPKDVPMDKGDEKNIATAIELIGNLGKQTIILEENPNVFNNLFSAMKNFESVANEYKKPLLKNLIKRQFLQIKKELFEQKNYKQKTALKAKLERKIRSL